MDLKHKDIEMISTEDTEVTLVEPIPEPKLPKGKQPRNYQDRSKYSPHQGNKECERRLRQYWDGTLGMPLHVTIVSGLELLTEDRQDPSPAEEV